MDRLYIIAGFLWLIAGMVFGIYLGITDQLQFANTHAHANLLGFVISVLFGLLYRNWPALMSTRLAWPQFALYEIGSLVLVMGKYDIDSGGDGALAPPGAVLVVIGTLVMFWIFARGTMEINVAKKRIV
ncbi:MAG: hypothetical protein P1U75_01220 [Antarcticimicrobium sp.]|uniref:hypothetical protein n=1 Tax=Antarcticimicrobium sp. TaxID=2824147 RepID=UPI002613EEC4|nr:hypothetical protein [Antarcticimicrobium sp.]MDF1715281.1 hypothetical protein [Antarcticimicrobium sp.]